MRTPQISALFPYTTLFRSLATLVVRGARRRHVETARGTLQQSGFQPPFQRSDLFADRGLSRAEVPRYRGKADRKSTRLNSSHPSISYAVFCLKKKFTVASI